MAETEAEERDGGPTRADTQSEDERWVYYVGIGAPLAIRAAV